MKQLIFKFLKNEKQVRKNQTLSKQSIFVNKLEFKAVIILKFVF